MSIAIGIDTGIGIDTTCLVTVGPDTPVQYYYGMPTPDHMNECPGTVGL
jgi:hypothetical protein